MKHYDDETIGAYVDGELSREAAQALESDLVANPALRRRVIELRRINSILREWCVRTSDETTVSWPVAAAVVTQDRGGRRVRHSFIPYASHALAAGVALLVGLGMSQFVNFPVQRSLTDDEAVHRLLQAALEHTMSGQAMSWTDSATKATITIEPLRTYRAGATFCREYRESAALARQDDVTSYGLACRSPAGPWNVEYTLAPGAQPLFVRR